jgi:hypothetical protein
LLSPPAGSLEPERSKKRSGDRVRLPVDGTPGVPLGSTFDSTMLHSLDVAEIAGGSIKLTAK